MVMTLKRGYEKRICVAVQQYEILGPLLLNRHSLEKTQTTSSLLANLKIVETSKNSRECIALVKELGAEVEYIVLPTFAYEHKVFAGGLFLSTFFRV